MQIRSSARASASDPHFGLVYDAALHTERFKSPETPYAMGSNTKL